MIFVLTISASLVLYSLMYFVPANEYSFFILFALVFCSSFVSSPVPPLLDSAVMQYLGPNKQDYGRQRLWGAVGWGSIAPLSGLVATKLGIKSIFYLCAISFSPLVITRSLARSLALMLNSECSQLCASVHGLCCSCFAS
jgi:hypothetical protein